MNDDIDKLEAALAWGCACGAVIGLIAGMFIPRFMP